MKNQLYLIVVLTVLVFSGCTNPFVGPSESNYIEPMSVTLSSDLTTIKSGERTHLYLTLDNLDEAEEYQVEAKVMTAGIFKITPTPQTTYLQRLQKKDLEFELQSPTIYSDTPSTVSIQTKISKNLEIYLPIVFANRDYLIKMQQTGQGFSEQSSIIYLADNLIQVQVELNKNPPIDTSQTYANIRIVPLGPGNLDFRTITIDSGSCESIDEFSNTVSCTLYGGTISTIQEKKFKLNLGYDYYQIDSLSFMVLG